MESHLKQRLVGAAVLLSLAVIFLPLILSGPPEQDGRVVRKEIPAPPHSEFKSRVVPLDGPQWATPELPRPPVYAQDAAPVTEPVETKKVAEPRVQESGKAGLRAWAVQAATLATEESAIKFRDRLRKSGMDAFVDSVLVRKKQAWRVRVGPELEKKRADALKTRLAKEFKIKDAFVSRYP